MTEGLGKTAAIALAAFVGVGSATYGEDKEGRERTKGSTALETVGAEWAVPDEYRETSRRGIFYD
jgi:hypothetical protein